MSYGNGYKNLKVTVGGIEDTLQRTTYELHLVAKENDHTIFSTQKAKAIAIRGLESTRCKKLIDNINTLKAWIHSVS